MRCGSGLDRAPRSGERRLFAWKQLPGREVECGIGGVLGGLANLHPEEDRAVYTISYASQAGKESAKRRYRDAVLGKIKAAGKEAEE